MFSRILVAIEMSKAGRHVFETALALAKATGANLKVLHVLCPDEEGCPDTSGLLGTYYYPGTDDEATEHGQIGWEQYSQKCLERLRSLVQMATTEGVQAEFAQPSGKPSQAICEEARNWEADLIVIGQRGLSGWEKALLGSVSSYVIQNAPCSVLADQSPIRARSVPAKV